MAVSPPPRPRRVVRTDEFARWSQRLPAERQAKLEGAIRRVREGGPNLGRPHVDVIHGSKLHKLKEVRVDRGVRVLFAFDSKQDAVMLLGGDKTGKWNRWYPKMVQRAERLYREHERRNGKEPPWQRQTTRKPPPRSR